MKTQILSFRSKGVGVMTVACLVIVSGCKTPSDLAFETPINQKELADRWVGFNDRDPGCYTMILGPDSSGVLYLQVEGKTIATNQISNWRVQGDSLICQLGLP